MKKNLLIITICMLLVFYLGFGLMIYFLQNNFIYYPDKQNFNDCPGFSDAEKINASGTRAYFKNNSDKIIIFYHGNAASTCQRAYLKNKFEKLGFSYIFPEYTGYSDNQKTPTKERLFADVKNIDAFLKQHSFNKIYLAGESLGGAMATYHASILQNAPLLLISPFNSLQAIAKKSYPIYPVSLILRDKYDNGKLAPSITNVIIVHGEQDATIPIGEAKKLFNNFTGQKYFVSVPGAHHNDIYNYTETEQAIKNFLQ